MKKFLTLFIAFSLFSCDDNSTGSDAESTEIVDNFTIKGAIEGGENQPVYLEALSQQAKINVAESRTDHEGNFEMIGNIPGFGLYQLRIGESDEHIIPLTLVPDDEIKIESTLKDFALSPKVSGSRWASTMTRYMKYFAVFHVGQQELMAKKDSIPNDELTTAFIKLKAPVDSFAVNEMKKHPANPFNIVLQSSLTPSMGFYSWDSRNLDVLKAVVAAYEVDFPDSPITTSLANQVYQIEVAWQEHLANTSGIRAAPEIALNNPEGTEIKLSSLRGNYVLIDFWASWCAPCRQESPNVVRLYKKFRNKGFTVYSVSLDDNVEAWQEAIKKDGLIWPNHVSDLKKWESPLPQLYGFNGIPHTVLLNPEGNIIGVGLRGQELEQKLNELFAKK